MNKKILTIGIVSIFLLMGLTTVSAVEKKTVGLKTSSTAALRVGLWYKGLILEHPIYDAEVTAYNKDTGESYVLEHDMFIGYEKYNIPTGDYTITATHDDFKTESINVTLHEGHNNYDIYMKFKIKSAEAPSEAEQSSPEISSSSSAQNSPSSSDLSSSLSGQQTQSQISQQQSDQDIAPVANKVTTTVNQ